jgi:lipopolysaccharide export system protein LptA
MPPMPVLKALTIALLWLPAMSLYASTKDAQQPITIEADQAKVDEKRGISTYKGHVVLHQGGILIKGDKLMVYSQEGELEKMIATGKPVTYFQKGETTSTDISGKAQRMEYYANDNRLVLMEGAKLTQGPNQFSGNRITYDTEREVVSATVSESGKERVQVTIQPKKKDDKK